MGPKEVPQQETPAPAQETSLKEEKKESAAVNQNTISPNLEKDTSSSSIIEKLKTCRGVPPYRTG